MFSIIGIVVVFGAVLAGYLMEKGPLMVLMQPAEVVMICGAALGTMLVANPLNVLKQIMQGSMGVFKGSRYTQKLYSDSLKMLYDLFGRARREGLSAIESDIDDPGKSPTFSAYPAVMKDHHVRNFICDTMRTATSGALDPFDIDQIMEQDMEVHHHDSTEPVSALSTVADSLPGLGIVAAVLGVVITMGSLGGPPEEIGEKVAAALVGTFLGILLCYGVAGPLSSSMSKAADESNEYLHVLRVLMLSFLKGSAPMIAIELGRRAIPAHVRPSFDEMEKNCKGSSAEAAAA